MTKEEKIAEFEELLKEQKEFGGWHEGFEELQKKNIAANIEYFQKQIDRLRGKK